MRCSHLYSVRSVDHGCWLSHIGTGLRTFILWTGTRSVIEVFSEVLCRVVVVRSLAWAVAVGLYLHVLLHWLGLQPGCADSLGNSKPCVWLCNPAHWLRLQESISPPSFWMRAGRPACICARIATALFSHRVRSHSSGALCAKVPVCGGTFWALRADVFRVSEFKGSPTFETRMGEKEREGEIVVTWAYGNLTPYRSTLWVRVKRHATHHSGTVLCAGKIGREHSTCCGRNLCIVTNLYHNILEVFGLIILWHPEMSLISVDLIVVYWSVLHLILDSTWVWYSLLLELKIPTLVWHWNCLLCLRHWEAYSLQGMRTNSWNSWRRV